MRFLGAYEEQSTYSSADFLSKAELAASRAALEMRISEAERELESYNYTEEQIRDYLARYSGIKEMEPEAQKKALELFVERVVVGENNVNIAFTFNLGHNIQRTARNSGGSLEAGRDSNGGGNESKSEHLFFSDGLLVLYLSKLHRIDVNV